jgi:tRNA(Ile2) C34 agmatinyltransferase TiaS
MKRIDNKDLVLINRVGKRKLVKISLAVYNSVCNSCRGKMQFNPKGDLSVYCNECQIEIREVYKRHGLDVD